MLEQPWKTPPRRASAAEIFHELLEHRWLPVEVQRTNDAFLEVLRPTRSASV